MKRAIVVAAILAAACVSLGLSVGADQQVFEEGFEAGWGDWSADNGVWEIGVPTAGPPSAHSGTQCAGTVLGGDYPPDTCSTLESPAVTLPLKGSQDEEIRLRFWHWFSYGSGDYGEVRVTVKEGGVWGNWIAVGPSYTASSPVWSLASVDLTPYAGKQIRVGFYHYSDNYWTSFGWYIDDIIVLQGVPSFPTVEDFESGYGDWYAGRGVWEIGVPTAGPSSPHGGTQCAGTVLGGDYPLDTCSTLVSPAVTLPAKGSQDEEIRLRFWHWFSFGSGDYGEVRVTVKEGGVWGDWIAVGPSYTASSAVWSLASVDLTSYAGKRIRVGFYHHSDNYWTSSGWYIDDVIVWQGVPSFPAVEDFESGYGDWYAGRGVWEIGVPTAGPSSAHGGAQCAGTVLGGDYPLDTCSTLVSPAVTLPAKGSQDEEIRLRFSHWFSYGDGDHGEVRVTVKEGGVWGDWIPVGPWYTSSSGAWSQASVDLTPYAGKRIRVGFYHYSDNYWTSSGWYIDDVIVPRGGLPLVVETLPASSVTCSSAVLNGRVVNDGGLPIIKRGFDWGTDPDPANWTEGTNVVTVSGADFSRAVGCFKPGTKYYYWAWAKNQAGVWRDGGVLSFTTLPCPRLTVETRPASSITSTSAVLNGRVVSDGGSPIIKRGFDWGTDRDPAKWTDGTETVTVSGADFSRTVDRFKCGTKYYFWAWAKNQAGVWRDGGVLSFTTLPCARLTVETRPASSITSTSAVLNGTVVSDGGSPIIKRGFDWGTDPDPEKWTAGTSLVTVSGADFSRAVSWFKPGTTYYYWAWAKNQAGVWAHGSPVNFTTAGVTLAAQTGVAPEATREGPSDDGSFAGLFFAVTRTEVVSTDPLKVRLIWTAMPGEDFRIFWTDDLTTLAEEWNEVVAPWPNMIVDGEECSWVDDGSDPSMLGLSPADVRQRFYRVELAN